MATQSSPRRPSWVGLAIILVVGLIVGVGIPFAYTNFMPLNSPASAVPVATAPPPPASPPKIDFLGPSAVNGATATLDSKTDGKLTTPLAVDDAMVVWLHVEPPKTGTPGGGGGGRGGLPITVKDPTGIDFSYAAERKDNGIVAIHIKRGYDKKPASLTVAETSAGKEVASWKVDNVPAPKLYVPDSAMSGKAVGEIQLRPGRRGRLAAGVHLAENLSKLEGVILQPVAATFTPIDTSQTGVLISDAGGTLDAPLNLPNPKMARYISCNEWIYRGVKTTETVTFKSAHIETKFGQATLIVDKDEVVITPSGLKVILPKQDSGPKRQMRHIHDEVKLEVHFDTTGLKGKPVDGISPFVNVTLLQPTPASLGLEQIRIETSFAPPVDGQNVFKDQAPKAPPKAPTGTPKLGPINPLTLEITVIRPQVMPAKRIVLPVNHKVLARAGAGTQVGAATPRQ